MRIWVSSDQRVGSNGIWCGCKSLPLVQVARFEFKSVQVWDVPCFVTMDERSLMISALNCATFILLPLLHWRMCSWASSSKSHTGQRLLAIWHTFKPFDRILVSVTDHGADYNSISSIGWVCESIEWLRDAKSCLAVEVLTGKYRALVNWFLTAFCHTLIWCAVGAICRGHKCGDVRLRPLWAVNALTSMYFPSARDDVK